MRFLVVIAVFIFSSYIVFAQPQNGVINITARVQGCGNGVIESGESCDGEKLNNQTCVTQGFLGGSLSCYKNCSFNISACSMKHDPPSGGGGGGGGGGSNHDDHNDNDGGHHDNHDQDNDNQGNHDNQGDNEHSNRSEDKNNNNNNQKPNNKNNKNNSASNSNNNKQLANQAQKTKEVIKESENNNQKNFLTKIIENNILGVGSENITSNKNNQLENSKINIVLPKAALDFSKDDPVEEQEVNASAGKTIRLVVVGGDEVRSVSGKIFYIDQLRKDESGLNLFFKKVLSFFGLNEVLAEGSEKSGVLFSQFDYKNNQGIFEANINAPIIGGKYKIISMVEPSTSKQKQKEITVPLTVEPDGYIYENTSYGQVRVQSAKVELFWQNTKDDAFESWQARGYGQVNPQTTGLSGVYSFTPPAGNYYLKVTAPNYSGYTSEIFSVKNNEHIARNIELKSIFWFNVFVGFGGVLFCGLVIAIFLKYVRKNKKSK